MWYKISCLWKTFVPNIESLTWYTLRSLCVNCIHASETVENTFFTSAFERMIETERAKRKKGVAVRKAALLIMISLISFSPSNEQWCTPWASLKRLPVSILFLGDRYGWNSIKLTLLLPETRLQWLSRRVKTAIHSVNHLIIGHAPVSGFAVCHY